MPTLLAIVFVVIGISIIGNTPEHILVGIGIVLAMIATFIAAWFGITYLLKASIGIVSNHKDW